MTGNARMGTSVYRRAAFLVARHWERKARAARLLEKAPRHRWLKSRVKSMKTFFRLAIVLVVVGVASLAKAQLALQILQDGNAEIVNIGSTALTYDGYQILDHQDPGRLIPENLRSVESLLAAGDFASVLNGLGAGALGLSTYGLSPNNIAELTAGAGGTLQPGARWSLGQIFPAGLPLGPNPVGFVFAANDSWYGHSSFIDVVPGIPEPSAVLLAGMGLVSLVALARRRTNLGQLAST